MRAIGFSLETRGLRYTVLEGPKTAPLLIEKDRIIVKATTTVPQLMDWFDSTFQNLLVRIKPDKVACKLNLDASKTQIPYWYYPYGILNGIAYKEGLNVAEFVAQNFTPSKFGLPKATNLYEYIDATVGVHPPYWDRNQKYSVLAAWMVLE